MHGHALLLIFCIGSLKAEELRKFPDGFLLGAATASYQIEGGWDEDGKGENIWDRLTHTTPWYISDGSNGGDVACDSYHNWQRDIEMMRELNLDAYRFSISWSRVLPTGFPNKVNEPGVAYYNNLINEMLKYNIQPMVTLYHWDLPQSLQDLGGFANPHFVDWFGDYAKFAFETFGDRVKYWITFNEPREICFEGYEDMNKAPMINSSGIGPYLCAKNLVVAHARAYHVYNEEFKPEQAGTCGITISTNWFDAASDSADDIEATLLTRAREVGIYAHPIFVGDYPSILKERIAQKSAEQGFSRSRLIEFTQDEIDYVKGTYDFYGINHYSTIKVYRNESVYSTQRAVPSSYDDIEAFYYVTGEDSTSPWLKFTPGSLYNSLVYIKENYNDPDIFVTENGWASNSGYDDDDRINYYRTHFNGVLDAIDDGVKVKGFTAWSLMDNMEWLEGYTPKLGIYEVDFDSPERTRTPRKSAFVYKEIARSRVIDLSYEPNTTEMWIEEGH